MDARAYRGRTMGLGRAIGRARTNLPLLISATVRFPGERAAMKSRVAAAALKLMLRAASPKLPVGAAMASTAAAALNCQARHRFGADEAARGCCQSNANRSLPHMALTLCA